MIYYLRQWCSLSLLRGSGPEASSQKCRHYALGENGVAENQAEMSIRVLKDSALPTDNITQAPKKDRRMRLRFPLATELKYQVLKRGGGPKVRVPGIVENIGSRGLAFRPDGPLQAGWRLSVSMAWAAKLDDCMLRLVFEGVILRTSGNLVIVTIEHPDFRTAGKATAAAREEIATTARDIGALYPASVPTGAAWTVWVPPVPTP
jgi:hypothetical protein